jgi:hypothetical protein
MKNMLKTQGYVTIGKWNILITKGLLEISHTIIYG